MGGGYAHQTKGTPMALAAEINKMKVQIDALRRQIVNIGIQIDTVDNELIIGSNRSLVVNGSETVGGSLTVTGNTVIEGNLSVPNGSISNAALQNPIYPVATYATARGFAVTTTQTTNCTATLTTPSGFTQCLLLGTADYTFYNAGSSDVFAYGNCHPGSASPGYNSAADVPALLTVEVSNSAQNLLTGLASGQNINVTATSYTGGGTLAASTDTWVNLAVIALFLR